MRMRFIPVAVAAVVACVASPVRAADAGAKTLIDYFLPTPIVCPLTSKTWGAPGVLPRDVCNGLEDSTNTQWQYWDGKILVGADGSYHMYAGRWPQASGFADWPNSVMVEAVSTGGLIGSYVPKATTAAPLAGKEQNVTGMPLDDGTFALIDSPGKIYVASSLDGPWTARGVIQITTNGTTTTATTEKNQTFWQSANGSFLIVNRTFSDMTSASNILGPYVVQGTIPNESGFEDPVVWCSGGQYHMVANNFNERLATHYTSVDGVHNWVNKGLAYDPTSDFVRYTDGTVNHWFKMERPGVVLADGHVTAFTFAVIDVDKTLDLANDIHGTKIIVVPFDGVSLDRDDPGPGSAGCPLTPVTGLDAGRPEDAGKPADASVLADARAPVDASQAVDGRAGDASGLADALPEDAGELVDSATTDATGSTTSSGGAITADAAGPPVEAGEDAGGVEGSEPAAGGCSCRIGAVSDRGGVAGGLMVLVGTALAAGQRRRRNERRRSRSERRRDA
jgi:hypothetical protein